MVIILFMYSLYVHTLTIFSGVHEAVLSIQYILYRVNSERTPHILGVAIVKIKEDE